MVNHEGAFTCLLHAGRTHQLAAGAALLPFSTFQPSDNSEKGEIKPTPCPLSADSPANRYKGTIPKRCCRPAPSCSHPPFLKYFFCGRCIFISAERCICHSIYLP